MKTPFRNRFLSVVAAAFVPFTVNAHAETITANASARILAIDGNLNDQGALSDVP